MVIVALSFSCFALAQIAGGSGFISCFAGGFLFGVLKRKSKLKVDLLESAEGAGDTLSLITWLIFGSLVVAAFIHELSWQIVVYARTEFNCHPNNTGHSIAYQFRCYTEREIIYGLVWSTRVSEHCVCHYCHGSGNTS